MIITTELIAWAKSHKACKAGIVQAEKLLGQPISELDVVYRYWFANLTTDQTILASMKDDKNVGIRICIVRKIEDTTILESMKDDEDVGVRFWVASRLEGWR